MMNAETYVILRALEATAKWLFDKVFGKIVSDRLAGPVRQRLDAIAGGARRLFRRGFLARSWAAVGSLARRIVAVLRGRPVLSFEPLWKKALVFSLSVVFGGMGGVFSAIFLIALTPYWLHFGALPAGKQAVLVLCSGMLAGSFWLCSTAAEGAWKSSSPRVR
jgi:hypothetical protein